MDRRVPSVLGAGGGQDAPGGVGSPGEAPPGPPVGGCGDGACVSSGMAGVDGPAASVGCSAGLCETRSPADVAPGRGGVTVAAGRAVALGGCGTEDSGTPGSVGGVLVRALFGADTDVGGVVLVGPLAPLVLPAAGASRCAEGSDVKEICGCGGPPCGPSYCRAAVPPAKAVTTSVHDNRRRDLRLPPAAAGESGGREPVSRVATGTRWFGDQGSKLLVRSACPLVRATASRPERAAGGRPASRPRCVLAGWKAFQAGAGSLTVLPRLRGMRGPARVRRPEGGPRNLAISQIYRTVMRQASP